MSQDIHYGTRAGINTEKVGANAKDNAQPSHSNIQRAVYNLDNVITQLKYLKSEIKGIDMEKNVEGENVPTCEIGSLYYVLTYATSSIEEKHNAMLNEIQQIRELLFGDGLWEKKYLQNGADRKC